jgi:hypothetical protein
MPGNWASFECGGEELFGPSEVRARPARFYQVGADGGSCLLLEFAGQLCYA